MRHLKIFAFTLLLAGCAATPPDKATPPTRLADIGEVTPGSGMPKGYLEPAQVPDSLALLPAPPAAGTARFAADLEAYQQAAQNTSPERWTQAAADADLKFPRSTQSFAQVLGVQIDSEGTPHLAMLLQRTLVDAGLGTYKAKNHYQRTRPFVVENSSTCTPRDEQMLRKDGSYPSGHAAIGWAWALVLIDLSPDKADALLRRGIDFGQSRVACRVHWQSDVDAGRVTAAAVVARLNADPQFRAQLELARAEVAAARK